MRDIYLKRSERNLKEFFRKHFMKDSLSKGLETIRFQLQITNQSFTIRCYIFRKFRSYLRCSFWMNLVTFEIRHSESERFFSQFNNFWHLSVFLNLGEYEISTQDDLGQFLTALYTFFLEKRRKTPQERVFLSSDSSLC